ncbi:surface-adhesin E family protein [uncultured Brevundimonas sp.]|uniref:surface-adhesin E family protein n=1 Tax=uncultured Brevundimonas sp. TaxID=213418 RepID=UPI0030ED7C64|tara:strand:+ start:16110 stop:16547 length:438 start_codon:yes stop_codon:yes gene_type:complete
MKTLLSLALAAVTLAAGPAAAENWHKFSYSSRIAYLADVDSISVEGEVTAIHAAKVPQSGAAGDYTHSVDTFTFRCGARQVRSILSVDYGPDGTETGRFDDAEAPWDPLVRDSYLDFLKAIACDGERSSEGSWPSIAAYVDSRRR